MSLEIRTGIPGRDQEGSFMNATLQSNRDYTVDYSIAVRVDLKAETEEKVEAALRRVFGDLAEQPGIEIEIEIGPGPNA